MAATKALPVARALPSVFYEDPEPVEDGMEQAGTIVEITRLLRDRFIGDPRTLVSSGGFIFYDITDNKLRIAPDIYIAFDVDVEGLFKRRPANYINYLIWIVGQAPGLRAGSGVPQHRE